MPDVPSVRPATSPRPGWTLVDLFIGSEGTLGDRHAVTFRILRPAPAFALALIPCGSEAQALALVGALRDASLETWRTADTNGIDAAAIEHMDARSLAILREDGADAQHDVSVPPGAALALLVQLELPAATTPEQAYDEIASALDDPARQTPLARFCRLLDAEGLLDAAELALPGDRRRAEQLIAIREAVPYGVNRASALPSATSIRGSRRRPPTWSSLSSASPK
jgi:FAD/FMN-containing dehydrogenase